MRHLNMEEGGINFVWMTAGELVLKESWREAIRAGP